MNFSKGKLLQIVGDIVFFTCWILPLLFTEGWKASANVGMIVLVWQMAIGGFLMFFGSAIQKEETRDPDCQILKSIFNVFSNWQIFLIIALAIMLVLLSISILCEFDEMMNFVMVGILLFVLVSAIGNSVQNQKRKEDVQSPGGGNRTPAYTPYNPSAKCKRCNKALNYDDRCYFEGAYYCSSCYMEVEAARQRATEEKSKLQLQTNCHICGRLFPKSNFHVVDDQFICEECFQKEFSVKL